MKITSQIKKFIIDNPHHITTVLGAAGVVVTSILTGRATYRAFVAVEKKYVPPSTKEIIKEVWPYYIPAVSSGVLTITCIVASNRVSTRRAAALATAYSLTEKATTEYRDKVFQYLGEKKAREVDDSIAQDLVTNKPPSTRELYVPEDASVLFCDAYSGRYFRSKMEHIRRSENDINRDILQEMSASLGDFYRKIGLAGTSDSEEVGWTVDLPLEIRFSTALTEDDKPCIVINYTKSPIRNYYKLG